MLSSYGSSPKILIRSPNWIGDAVMATPVPRAFKRTLPTCRVHVLAAEWAAPLWERHPDVDAVIRLDPDHRRNVWSWFRLVRRLRRERYALTVILPNSFSSAWLAFWGSRGQRVGYAMEHRSWLLTLGVPWFGGEERVPRPQAYLKLARAAGADVDLAQEWLFYLKVTPEELNRADELLGPSAGKLRIGLAPGSVAPSRRWPAERFARLADHLAEGGYFVVLVGSGADAAVAQAVARRARIKPLVLAGKTTLREGMAVIRRLDLLVSNDSGAMHLAYAQGVPVLALQGAADPRVTGPFGPHSHVLRAAGVDCAPCVRNECRLRNLKCMQAISVEAVLETLQSMLAEKSERNPTESGS